MMERAWGDAGGGMELGMRWRAAAKQTNAGCTRGGLGKTKKKAMGSYYLIVQGYGEVPPGALHLVLGTLLL